MKLNAVQWGEMGVEGRWRLRIQLQCLKLSRARFVQPLRMGESLLRASEGGL